MTEWSYDGNGNRTSLKQPLEQGTAHQTSFVYDPLNRLTSLSYSDGATPSVSYGYDAHGNRTSMQDGTGQTTYQYDEQDRLLAVTSPGPKTVGYRYDLDGHRVQVIYPDSTAVTYTIDQGSRLASLSDWASRTTSYQYRPDGKLQTATNVNTTTTGYSYDNTQRLTQVWHQQGANTISQHTYTLDSIGNRTRAEERRPVLGPPLPLESLPLGTIDYGYDTLSRLTSVNAPSGQTTYDYDPVGNRLTMTRVTGTSYSYDRADRITAAGATACTVDANGNLVARGTDSFGYEVV